MELSILTRELNKRAVSKSNEASELDLQTCSDRKKRETGKYIEKKKEKIAAGENVRPRTREG